MTVEQILNSVLEVDTEFSDWPSFIHFMDAAAQSIHHHNKKWWVDLETGEPIKRNVGELLALIHSEISEALEGHRKNLMDDKLPNRRMFDVELADAIIRILDICGSMKINIGQIIFEKVQFNITRADHSIKERLGVNGKKY